MVYKLNLFETMEDLRRFLNGRKVSREDIIHIAHEPKAAYPYKLLWAERRKECLTIIRFPSM